MNPHVKNNKASNRLKKREEHRHSIYTFIPNRISKKKNSPKIFRLSNSYKNKDKTRVNQYLSGGRAMENIQYSGLVVCPGNGQSGNCGMKRRPQWSPVRLCDCGYRLGA
ncbi:MAG: Mlp family lipoprotein [Bacteroidota bacterium]